MAWVVGFWVVLTLLAAAGAACAWLASERRGLRGEARRLADELQRCESLRASAAEENADLVLRVERTAAEHAGAVAEVERERALGRERLAEARASFDARLAEAREQFDQLQKQAREVFQACAGDALKGAAEGLLAQAREAFENRAKFDAEVWAKRAESIDSLVKPIRESLDRHEKAVVEIEKHREGAYHGLKQQVVSMQEAQSRLQAETQNLVGALRRPDVRGQWGEMTLRRLVELAGMVPHCDFDEQVSVRSVEGVKKPDLVVRMPAGRQIVVDAKTPMAAFLDAIRCGDDESRTECFKRHLGHIQQKVQDLSSKRYQDQFDRSPDFVVLFIPGESFLQPAVQLEPDLLERAMNFGVVIATPTTLIALLKVVALGFREERIAQNAKQISDLGVELHKRIATAVEHLVRLGSSIESTVKNFNRLVGSVETSVMPQARRFKELGADSSKELPADGQLQQVEQRPREAKPAEV